MSEPEHDRHEEVQTGFLASEENALERPAESEREEENAPSGPSPLHGLDFLAHEFLLWLWYRSDQNFSQFKVGDKTIDLWVDDKITFQATSEERVINTFSGGAPSTTPEARLSILSGKVIEEMRMGMRLDDQEWSFGLKATEGGIQLRALRAPAVIREGVDEMLYERIFLIEEIIGIVHRLFRRFFEERSASTWTDELAPSIMRWLLSEEE